MAYIQETLVHQTHPKTVMTTMQQLQTQQILCDLTLLTKDGGNFPVHKLVMISGSEYFKTLLDKGMLNAEGLIMHDITGNSLQQLIHYLYTGVAYVNKYTIMQLYTAASQLSIVSLKKLCRDYVRRNAKSMGLADDLLEEMKTVWAREDAMARQNKDLQQSMITSPIGGDTGFPPPVAPPVQAVTATSAMSQSAVSGGKVVYYPDEAFLDTDDVVEPQIQPDDVVQETVLNKPENTDIITPDVRREVAGVEQEKHSENLDQVKHEIDSKPDDDLGTFSYGELESTEDDEDSDDLGVNVKGLKRPLATMSNVPSKRKRGRPRSVSTSKASKTSRALRSSVKSTRKTKKPLKSVTKTTEKHQPIKLKIKKSDVDDYNKFICSICGDGFCYDTFLKMHKLKEHASMVPTVGLNFILKKYHRLMYNPKPIDGVYHCLDCQETFTNLARLGSHEIQKHPQFPNPIFLQPKAKVKDKRRRKYSCNLCQPQRYFLHLNLLRKHNGVVHGDVVQAEEVVNRKTKTASRKNAVSKPKVKKRLLVTLPVPAPGNIMCQLCNLPIANQVELAHHLQQDHDVYTLAYNKSKIKLQCPDCRKACAGNRNTYKLLRKHIKSAHGTDIARQCFYCGRNMNSRTSLNHHLKSSHRINPSIMKLDPIMRKYIVGGERAGSDDVTGTLRCHYCRTAFTTDSELAEHLRTMHAQFASFIRISAKDKSDNYDCQRCHRVFQTVDEIQVHFVDDHGPGRRMKNRHTSEILGIFRCREESCYWETKEEAALEDHMKEEHPRVKYDCHQCQYTTALSYKLDEHLPKHTSKFICDLCGKECRKNFALKTHKFRKHNIQDASLKVHHCEFDGCRFTCFQKSSLKGHMIKHQKDKPFTCPTCGRSLKTAQSLEMHNNKVHKGIRPYMCEICGRGFSKQCEIRAHVRQHSSESLKCEHCKFSTMNKYSLISHLLSRHNIQVRENEKLYHCPMCDYKTMREKHLTNHINSHLNVREFICSKCGKSFVSANSLRGHNNWVHSEKRYRCEFCSYRGGSLSNLKQHVRIMHTQRGLKPYKCAYCDFRCELSGNCRVHCRSAHKGLDIKWVKVVDFNLDLPKKGLGLLDDEYDDGEDLPTMVPTTSQVMAPSALELQLTSTPPPVQNTMQIPITEISMKKDSALAQELQQETHEIHDLQDLREIAAAQEAREVEIARQSATPGGSHTPQTVLYQQETSAAVMYQDSAHAAIYLSEPIPTTRTPYYPTDANLYDTHRAQLYMPQDAHASHVYQHQEGGGMYTN